MRFKEFLINGRYIENSNEIEGVLIENNLEWLINSEIEDAVVEIKHKTLIWEKGDYNAGNWHYGIWLEGRFSGIWENGIWEGGVFDGKWESGIDKNNP